MIGGWDYMGSDDTSIPSEKIFKRDRYKCRNCKRKGGDKGDVELHTHHIVSKAKGGDDTLSNLVALCKECHQSVHNGTSAPTAEDTEITDYTDDTIKDTTDIRPNNSSHEDVQSDWNDFAEED